MSHDPAFFHHVEQEQVHKRHRNRRRFRAVIFSLVALIGVWVILMFIVTGQLVAQLLDGKDILLKTEELVSEFQFSEANEALEQASLSWQKARNSIVLAKQIALVSPLKRQFDDLDIMISSAQDIINSFQDLLNIAEDMARLAGLNEKYLRDIQEGISPNVTFEDLPAETKRAILLRLNASANQLELLGSRLKLAQSELDLIMAKTRFSPMSSTLKYVKSQLEELQSIEVLQVAARLLPDFAGLDQERTHLLLFLNNDELRPGGGFIGVYGVMVQKDGEIISLETEDVYALDRASEPYINTISPEPLRVYNNTPHWFFRDGNWSPDFAVSSLQVINQFIAESSYLSPDQRNLIASSRHIDTVTGFTPTFVSELLKITGPLQVQGQTFRFDNVAELLEYQVERGYQQDGVPIEQRKEILADLVIKMQERLYEQPLSSWGRLLEVVREGFISKQLAVFSQNTKTEEVISKMGWGGRLQFETPDVQMVVDANLASLKSDPVVKRDIKYEIFKNSSGQFIGRTTISYNHTGSFDWRTSRYRSYIRLYLPKGTQPIRVKGSLLNDKTKNPTLAPGSLDVSEELDFTVMGTFVAVEPREKRDLVFEYALSPTVQKAINEGDYSLTFFKQLGARNYPLTLDLDFDKNVTHAVPAEEAEQWGDDVYLLNTILDQDQKTTIGL